MSVASKLITIAENLQTKLDAINAKLTAKGQTAATSLNDIPTKIEAIETGVDTSDATATASDVLADKTAYVNGEKITGNIATKTGSDITVSGATCTAPAGYYASPILLSVSGGTVNSPSISVSTSGLITTSTSVSAGYVTSGTVSNTKQLSTQSGKTITPGTSQQVAVSSGVYTTGSIYVSGDSNLVSSNIKSGVSIFGVSGSYTGGGSVGYITGSVNNSVGGYSRVEFTTNVDMKKVDNFVIYLTGDGYVTSDDNDIIACVVVKDQVVQNCVITNPENSSQFYISGLSSSRLRYLSYTVDSSSLLFESYTTNTVAEFLSGGTYALFYVS